MKKIIIALLAAWALSACSNGENDTLEATNVHFRLDNTPLDANDDGFLDSKQ